jgi:ABC-2 type transport system permease protein
MTGVGILLRAYLRRDRWMLLWWTIGITVLYWAQAVSVDGLYATQAEFDRAAAAMESNATFVAMAGPARALNTIGGQVAWQATAFGAIAAGLMSMLLVGRHTRAEEENGRDELLRASPVDRGATTTAAICELGVANALVGTAVALSLISWPLAVADSVALGVGMALSGACFGAVALVAVQLTSSTRAAYGLTGAVIGLAYVLRAVGDVGTPALTWLSPIGWYQQMYAFSGLRWWPAALLVAAAVLTGAVARAVFWRRDWGSGVLASRPGPAHATDRLGSPLGLAWRLQRGSVLGWALGMLFLGALYGTMGRDVEDFLGDSELSRDMLAQGGGDVVDGFYATSILMLALMASGFAIASVLRPRSEEDDGRVEALLATGLDRSVWLAGHVAVTVVGTVVTVVAAGVGLGIGYALTTGDGARGVDLAVATVPWVAPVLVLAGTTRLLHGLAPRAASLAWLLLVLVVVVMLFGEVFSMPQWLQDLSPFEHMALVPAESFRWAPVVVLVLLAATLSATGQLAFRRRDVR